METRTYTSPDGLLRFIVISEDGDVTLGFEGFPWHTHADVLAATDGLPEDAAVERFLNALLTSKAVIAISRRQGEILDIWITDDPLAELRYAPADESIEFRYWNGAVWRPTAGS